MKQSNSKYYLSINCGAACSECILLSGRTASAGRPVLVKSRPVLVKWHPPPGSPRIITGGAMINHPTIKISWTYDMWQSRDIGGRPPSRAESRHDLFLCPKCDRIYQERYYGGRHAKIEYLPEFPKYGQKKKICPHCRGIK